MGSETEGLDVDHDFRVHPLRAVGVLTSDLITQGARRDRQRLQNPLQPCPRNAGDTATDPPAIDDPLRGRLPQQQRAETMVRAALAAPTAHHPRGA